MASSWPPVFNILSPFSFSDGHFGDLRVVSGNSLHSLAPSKSRQALFLAGDCQISCASMVHSNNLKNKRPQTSVWNGQGPERLPQCVCLCADVSVTDKRDSGYFGLSERCAFSLFFTKLGSFPSYLWEIRTVCFKWRNARGWRGWRHTLTD